MLQYSPIMRLPNTKQNSNKTKRRILKDVLLASQQTAEFMSEN